jgi:hypothetical protein
MRGDDSGQPGVFSYISAEERVLGGYGTRRDQVEGLQETVSRTQSRSSGGATGVRCVHAVAWAGGGPQEPSKEGRVTRGSGLAAVLRRLSHAPGALFSRSGVSLPSCPHPGVLGNGQRAGRQPASVGGHPHHRN